MASEYRQRTKCQHCGKATSTEDAFGAWTREFCGRELSIQDVDYIIHRFVIRGLRGVHCQMIVETKTQCRDMDDPQRDTLGIMDQVMRTHPFRRNRNAAGMFIKGHSEKPIWVWSTFERKPVRVKLFGVHKLRMSGLRPDDSEWMTWDNRGKITVADLIRVLRFELHPDTLKPFDPARSHHPQPKEHPSIPFPTYESGRA